MTFTFGLATKRKAWGRMSTVMHVQQIHMYTKKYTNYTPESITLLTVSNFTSLQKPQVKLQYFKLSVSPLYLCSHLWFHL